MKLISIPAEATAETITELLERKFPGILFAVRMVTVTAPLSLKSLDIFWVKGPSREEVIEAVEPFQGIIWDPLTGWFEQRFHLQVNEHGELVEVRYGIDYVFCEGPLHTTIP